MNTNSEKLLTGKQAGTN